MDAKAISCRLITLRGEQSQEKVAKAIGVSRSAYANYEQGTRIPRDDIKEKIADYFNSSVGAIFYEENVTVCIR